MDLVKQLEDALAIALKNDRTVYAIAKKAGLKPELLYRFIRGERSLQLASAAKLAKALGLGLADIQNGSLPLGSDSDSTSMIRQRSSLETKGDVFPICPLNKENLGVKTDSTYYVYAYFDPRRYEMFYVGKGQGSRKDAHIPNKLGTVKERQIHEIRRAGLEPLIRVIATNLTEDQALLVEKTLIWRTGASLTNVSGGHYAENFRPPDTLHQSLPGFDTSQGIYFVNVGGNKDHRDWEDCRKYGFLAAGHGPRFSSQLYRLDVGSIGAAYLNRKGYVGIARVIAKPVPARDFRYQGRPLRPRMLKGPELLHNDDDDDECEHLVAVKWIKDLSADDARFRRKAGLFAGRLIVASLSGQPKTLKFLEQQFGVTFEKLLSRE